MVAANEVSVGVANVVVEGSRGDGAGSAPRKITKRSIQRGEDFQAVSLVRINRDGDLVAGAPTRSNRRDVSQEVKVDAGAFGGVPF